MEATNSGDGVDALIFQIDQVIHFYTIDTAEVRFYTPVTPLSTETITNGLPHFCHVGAWRAPRPSLFPLFIL